MAKDTRIAFRVSEDLKERLQSAAQNVGLSETALAEACVVALVEYIEKHGEIRLPLAVVPKSEADRLKLGASSRTGSTAISPSGRRGVEDAVPGRALGLSEEPSDDYAKRGGRENKPKKT